MNNHLILSCHESDYETMAALLAGMEAHSDFVTADMNELWRRAQTLGIGDYGPKPEREAWHGFTFPYFPWRTLLSLLESASWTHLDKLRFVWMPNEDVGVFTLSQFSRAINGNHLT